MLLEFALLTDFHLPPMTQRRIICIFQKFRDRDLDISNHQTVIFWPRTVQQNCFISPSCPSIHRRSPVSLDDRDTEYKACLARRLAYADD